MPLGMLTLFPSRLIQPVFKVPTSKEALNCAVFISISVLKCLHAPGDSLQLRQFAQEDAEYCADHGLYSLFIEQKETSVA